MNRNASKTTTPIYIFFGVLAVILVIGVLLSSALEAGAWTFIALVFGLVVAVAVVAWLVSFIVRQYVQVTDTRVKAREIDNNFQLAMAKAGFLPPGFEPITPQIATSQQRSKIFDFNPNDIHTAAVNYLLYSKNLLGDGGNRLASAPECAAAGNIENYSARAWERIVTHLSNAYGVVRVPGPIQNGGGTYVPENIGTVGALYQHVLLNSAVEALPGVTR